MSEPTSSERFPFDLGPYEVLAPISRGGMAEVFVARLRDDRERVFALKVIRKVHERNAEFVSMFVDEARIASRLAHPAIGAIVGLGHDAGRHFIVMELLRGRTLLELWDRAAERNERVPPYIVAWIAARVAEGLHHAHELRGEDGEPLGVVHRDVSPSNIFITADGQPKLIDFGVARARDRLARTAVGVVKGKIGYVAPEQIEGKAADRRSDVFALGITLWEVSVGARLFRAATDVDTLRKIRAAEVERDRKSVV